VAGHALPAPDDTGAIAAGKRNLQQPGAARLASLTGTDAQANLPAMVRHTPLLFTVRLPEQRPSKVRRAM